MKKFSILILMSSLLVSCTSIFMPEETTSNEAAKTQTEPNPSLLESDENKTDEWAMTPQQAKTADDEEFDQALSDQPQQSFQAMKDERISKEELKDVHSESEPNTSTLPRTEGILESQAPKLVEDYRPTPSPKSPRPSSLPEKRTYTGRSHKHHPAKNIATKHTATKKISHLAKHSKKSKVQVAHQKMKSQCKKIAKHNRKTRREIAMCKMDKPIAKVSHKSRRSNRLAASQESRYR
jgi:hypothetical protein